jgi:hypothetical protein
VIIKIHKRHNRGYEMRQRPDPYRFYGPVARALMRGAGMMDRATFIGDLYYHGRLLGPIRHVEIKGLDTPADTVITVDFAPARQ